MYTEVIFRPAGLAGQRIYPEQAREIVAKALDGVAANPLLFNRDANGRTLNVTIGHIKDGRGWGAAPSIVYDGGLGFIRIYGIGQTGSDVLQEETTKIFSALMKAHGITAVEMKRGKAEIEFTGHATLHRIRRLVVGKKPGVFYNDPITDDRIQSAIRRHIVGGLFTQADLIGGQMEGRVPLEDDIDILEGRPTKAVIIDKGLGVSAYQDLVIAMPIRLKGPWLAGHLRSRGYGMIRAVDPTRETRGAQA